MSNAALIASVAQPTEAEHEPTALLLNPGGWVALAMREHALDRVADYYRIG